ncbi:MAG: protein kinase [Planctomycetaceae bacterium]
MPPLDSSEETSGFEITPPFNNSDGPMEPPGVRRFRDMLEGTRSDAILIGRTLKHYHLLEQLGAGAMGAVYKARNTETGEQVAVKVLDAGFVRQHEALQRFQKEARLLAEADSPFVTRLLDVCSDGDWHFLVTELVSGTNVAAVLKERGRLPESTALRIAADVAQALVDIAACGIIHRDIKPDNILLGGIPNGNGANAADTVVGDSDTFDVRLTDFGLARHTQQTQSMALTRANTVLGTPLFMSPEQFSDRDTLDARSDIYSLGATLFAMLTGQPPFPSADTLELAELHRHAAPPEVKSLNPKLSDGITAIVSKCLQKRPDLRYETAAELLVDLERLQRGEAIGILVHPVIPRCRAEDVQTFVFQWNLTSSPAELWPYVSNTERLNRAIGLPAVQYSTTVGQDGDVQVFASVRIAGMAMKWREHVFEWIEAQRMGVLREFEVGPLKWFTSVVEFLPTVDGQTRLVHRFQVESRGLAGRLFTKYKFGMETRRSLTRVYARIDATLAAGRGAASVADPFESAPTLTERQQRRLDALLLELKQQNADRETLLKTAEFVESASPQDAGRIRPLHLADAFNLPFDHVFEVLLRGVKVGLFELVWDVICPSCRLATQTYDVMQMVKDHEHCDACNLDFSVDLTHGVEAIFRVHSGVRRVDTGKYCIGGPAHSPHVIAQTRLAIGEHMHLGLMLPPGDYCIRGPQLPHTLNFVVGQPSPRTSGPSEADVKTGLRQFQLMLNPDSDHDWSQTPLVLTGDQQLISVVNGFSREVVVRVEHVAPRVNALTAARAISVPLFRELFPVQTFSRLQLTSVTTVTLFITKLMVPEESDQQTDSSAWPILQMHLQRLNALCHRSGGTWIKIVGRGALMSFVNASDAVRCAQQLPTTLVDIDAGAGAGVTVSGAIATGNVSVSIICGQLDYLGDTVEEVHRLLQTARPGECVMSD